MSNNDFAPLSQNNNKFIILNISKEYKLIKIFNYPIRYNTTRDIMAIPGVSEADIRASLLKGEIRRKIEAKEIRILESDIDLLQFNTNQDNFLTKAGVVNGTKVTPAQTSGITNSDSGYITYIWKQQIIPTGIKNGVNRIFSTPDLFLDGVYNGNTFRITVNFNGRLLLKDVDYAISKTSFSPGDGCDTITFISFAPTANSQLYVDYTVAIT